ncbi:MAG: hypothetical protein IT577_01075 [Verrucomicrobiae bacterium]|nr:hypothetical protein [Verrucomicrobiae bacterium]
MHHVFRAVARSFVFAALATVCFSSEAAQAKLPRLRIAGVVRDRDKKFTGTDYDNAEQHLVFRIKVANEDFQDHVGLKLKFIVIGECFHHEHKNGTLFTVLRSYELPFDIPKSGTAELVTPAYVTGFDTTDAKWGARYYAHAIVVRDKDGTVCLQDSSKASWIKDYPTVEGLEPKKVWDKNFKPVEVDIFYRDKDPA